MSSPPCSDGDRKPASAAPGDDTLQHGPLEYLYERFSRYIDDRRREPRDDVLTGLATATFPDGSTPEVIDVVRVATILSRPGDNRAPAELRPEDPRGAPRHPAAAAP
jgi:hypothetical protein